MKKMLTMVVAASVLSASACAAGALASEELPDAVALHDWVPGDVGMYALLEGTLDVRDGCLLVVSDDDGDDVVVAFPRALVDWDSATGVLTYAGVEYRVGDHVSAGGGGIGPSAEIEMPMACAALAAPFVFLIQDATLEP